jgi:hypothetical protein
VKRSGRLARLEQAAGTVRCPHCRAWIGPDAQRRTEEQEQTSRLWAAATVEELRQVRDIMDAIQARLGEGEGKA